MFINEVKGHIQIHDSCEVSTLYGNYKKVPSESSKEYFDAEVQTFRVRLYSDTPFSF